MIAVIIPTHAQINSLLHTLAYMFRPFWVMVRALMMTQKGRNMEASVCNKELICACVGIITARIFRNLTFYVYLFLVSIK
jgi:hypothetical protein